MSGNQPPIRVAVTGATGYVGGELLRLLLNHPLVSMGAVTGSTSVGQGLGQSQPHLHALADRVVEETSAAALADHDVVFLALPHGESAAVAASLGPATRVIDCGADFRLEDPDVWASFYGSEHAGVWPYGLPELPGARAALAGAMRIAVPGCYPTASALALVPAFSTGLVEPHDVVIVAASGTSGAGKGLRANLMASEVMGGMSPYGVGGVHRHTPEIEQSLTRAAGEQVLVSFTPTLAPMARGILATASARLKAGVTADALRAAYEKAYGDETFVTLLPEGTWPTTQSVLGSNVAALQVTVDERTNRLVAICAIDNLTKGTAGAAIQCMNLSFGLDEALGLPITGVSP
jgi:N-acetyl-gamma-glutamyl-phosphate reductase